MCYAPQPPAPPCHPLLLPCRLPHAAAPSIAMRQQVPGSAAAQRAVSRGSSRDALITLCILRTEVTPHPSAPPASRSLMAPARAMRYGLQLGTTLGVCPTEIPPPSTPTFPSTKLGSTRRPTLTLTLSQTLTLATPRTRCPPLARAYWTRHPNPLGLCPPPRQHPPLPTKGVIPVPPPGSATIRHHPISRDGGSTTTP